VIVYEEKREEGKRMRERVSPERERQAVSRFINALLWVIDSTNYYGHPRPSFMPSSSSVTLCAQVGQDVYDGMRMMNGNKAVSVKT